MINPKHDLIAEFLLLAREKRYRIFLAAFLTFSICFVLFKMYVIKYSSSLTFILDESNPTEVSITEEERVTLSQLNSVGKSRMFPIIFSDEMATRLNKSLNLAAHYHLDESDPAFYSNLLGKMRSKIHVSKSRVDQSVTIKVEDSNMEHAALIANAIFVNLNKINRQIVNANLQYKLKVYNSSMQSLDLQTAKDVENLNKAMSQLKNAGDSKQLSQEDLLYMKANILNIYSEATNHALDLKKEKVMSHLTMDAMQDSTIQNLYLVNKAYPQKSYKTFIYSGLYALGISVVVAFYYLFMIYFLNRNKHYLSLLLHGEQKESKPIDGKKVPEELLEQV